jgi:hypothetical protein
MFLEPSLGFEEEEEYRRRRTCSVVPKRPFEDEARA